MKNTCKKCGETKDISFFVKNKTKRGFENKCKKCASAYNKEYADKNKESIRSKRAEYRLNNIDQELCRSRDYHSKNKSAIKIKSDGYRRKNIDKIRIAERLYQIQNKELISSKMQINTDELKHTYIKQKLKQKGFTSNQITPELIEVQRIIIKTKRLCKTSQI